VRANVSVLALVRRYFPASQVGNTMAVVSCESSQQWWQRGAVNRNGSRDWGLFQLNDAGTLQGALRAIGVSFRTTREAQALALDARINTRAALAIYRDRGWSPWVCAYKQGIVAALWSNEPGPMNGRYDVGGDPIPLSPPRPTRTPTTPTPAPRPPAPPPVPAPPKRPAPVPSPTPSPHPSAPTPTGPSPTQSSSGPPSGPIVEPGGAT
jgi:hypothetical protein